MAEIPAVITEKAREIWPKERGGLLTFSPISYFRVGEGGWFYNTITLQNESRTPDATLTDLDIILDSSRAPASRRYDNGDVYSWFQKSFAPGDLTFVSPSILRCSCLLDTAEYNLQNAGTGFGYDPTGGSGPYATPKIWEIGIYNDAGDMVAYGTFPEEEKDGSKQIENIVRLIW